MRNDLRYSACDCFETFPFPTPDPRAVLPELEDIGQRLHDARADYMRAEQVGLTTTYNRLKDPTHTDRRITALRTLHETLDAAVLSAYAWPDLQVPPFCPATPEVQKSLKSFETEVIDRLFVPNAQRAEEERRKGAGGRGGGEGKAGGVTKGKARAADPQLTLAGPDPAED